MTRERHIVIIGNGIAGITAALSARNYTTAPITLIGNAKGATALSSALIDIAPTPQNLPSKLETNVHALLKANPLHPYHFSQRPVEAIISAVDLIIKNTRGLGFLPLSDLSPNILLPTEEGALKETASAPNSLLSADLNALSGGEVVVVGFENTRYCRPNIVADALSRRLRDKPKLSFKPLLMKNIFRRFADYAALPEVLAAHFDKSPTIADDIITELRDYGQKKLWLFPPILGIKRTKEFFERFRAELKSPLAEAIPVGSSVLAKRLLTALTGALSENGISHLPLKVTSVETKEDSVTQINTADGPVASTSVVLATGKFIGGGIIAAERPREEFFNLPLSFLDRTPDGGYEIRKIDKPLYAISESASHYRGYQPGLTAGVTVNSEFSPVDWEGRVVYKNLFAAGSILTAYSPVHHLCGMGTAIFSGYLAGRSAAKPQ
ncbi:MAG: hypothetical protein Kow0090_22270 [Myxococcota bacterium]